MLLRYSLNLLFTGLVCYAADWSMYHRMTWWQDLLVAASVVIATMMVRSARLPNFLIILAQFPLSIMIMLSFFNWDWQSWVYTYVVGLMYYVGLHVLLSLFVRYHSLFPAWNVRETLHRRQGSSL